MMMSSGTSWPASMIALILRPELAARGGLGAQHVAGGKLDQPVRLLEALGLRPLAGAGRPQQDQVHPRRPLSFAFLISPSY